MNKKLIVASLLLCLLFIVPAVSAHEGIDLNATDNTLGYSDAISEDINIGADNLESGEESVLKADGTGNTFADLEILINNHISSGTPLDLDKDYKNTGGYGGGITINGKITINGNNFTIDANKKGRIFDIKNSDVILNNIIFKNGKNDNGGAIFLEQPNIQIHNSTFADNNGKDGGAIRSSSGDNPVIIYNCNFVNNIASRYGGALSIGKNSEIYGCNFTGNKASSEGGAINVRSTGVAKIISDCIFENNNASYGGAIVFGGGEIKNCQFISNNGVSTDDGKNGGAVYSGGALTLSNSSFRNNKLASKKSYGSALYLGKGGTIENSNFTNNYCDADAEGYGGTIYSADKLTVTGCEFDSNTGAKNNYNIYQKTGKTLTISSTTFKTIEPTITVEEISGYVKGSGKFDIGVNNYQIKITLKANDTDETSGEATVKNGDFTFSIDKPKPGTYTLSIDNDDNIVTYNTNKYVINDAKSNQFTIDKYPVNLIVPSTVMASEGLEARIKITLTDENDKPLNGIVTIHINDKYEDVTIENGVGYYTDSSFTIGDYPFEVEFKENETYKGATASGTLIVEELDINHTYTQLQQFIDDTPEGKTLVLPYYFRFTDFVDEVTRTTLVDINKTITIDGAGNYISGENVYRIFNITADNVVLKNIIFTNGTADNGGAIYADSTGIVIENCTFENNTAENGGAIYVTSTGSASVQSSDFKNNVATEKGGAIYCDNEMTVSDSTFINNTAKNGGGIFTKDSTVDGSKFYNNSASERGGGLYSEGRTTVTNSVFDYNNITKNGRIEYLGRGGAAIFSTGELEVDYTNITNNLKDFVVRGNPNSYLGYGAVAFTNTTRISNSLFENNGGCYGGAISAGVNFYKDLTDYTFDIDNVTFNNNPSYEGGAIYVSTSNSNDPIKILFAEDIIFTVKNSRFNNNSAGYEGSKGYSPAGGAICVIDNKGYGNVTSCNFTGNYVHHYDYATGGAISLQDTRFNIDDCTFSDNYANMGGAIDFTGNHLSITSVLINNSRFNNNTAKTIVGGGIYYNSANLTLLNSNFTNNSAGTLGGAICAYVGSQLIIDNINCINNTANSAGGLYISKIANSSVKNANFTENTAEASGGGIYIADIPTDGKVDIDNTIFTKNAAKTYGGAIYSHTCNDLNVKESTFINNEANSNGGAIYSYNGSLDITDASKFDGNNATYGGAIYSRNDKLSISDNSQFVGNNASYGGAIYSRDGELSISDNSQFVGNNASSNGGAIYGNAIKLKINQAKFNDNHAKNYGGSIYLTGATNATIAGDFTNNTAGSYGGAIMLNGVSNPVYIDDSYFNKNIASYGSSIFTSTSTLYVSDTVFGRNRADSSSLTIDVPTPTYYPSTGVIKIVFKGCDNIANAIFNNGATTNVYISNITYEAFIKGEYFNKTTPVDYTTPDGLLGYYDDEVIGIHPADGADENADVWQDRREDAQIINVLITSADGSEVVFNQTGLLTDVYGNVSVKMNTFKPGKYKITAEHPLDDYYTQIKATKEFEIFDLDVKKTTNDVKVNRGENVEYTITVDNKGPRDLSDITVEDIIPNGFVFLDNSEGWRIVNQDNDKITFKYVGNNGILESGKSITLKLLFNTTIGGVFNNTALVSSNETTQRQVTSNNTTVLVPTHITVDNITVYPGTEVVIPINVTRDDGIPFDGNVTIIFPDGTNQTVEINKGSGNAKWLVPEEYVPEYGNDIKFDGDDYQLPSDGTGTITVVQVPTKVTVGDVTTYPGKTVDIPIEVTADNGLPVNGKVTITLPDGSKQTVEIKNGKGNAKWAVPKDYRSGKYKDNVKFEGDNTYLPSEGKGTIEVLKIPVKIKVGSVTAKPGQTVKIPIKVKPKYGPAFNGKIKVTLPDGTKKTVKIVNGKGIVKWTVPKGYKGKYDVSASFGGNDIYYPADATGKVKVIPEKQKKHEDKKDKKVKASHVEYKSKLESNATGNPVYLLVCILALLLNITIRKRR